MDCPASGRGKECDLFLFFFFLVAGFLYKGGSPSQTKQESWKDSWGRDEGEDGGKMPTGGCGQVSFPLVKGAWSSQAQF